MTNPIDDNIPSIKPDLDQVEAYRSTKKPSKAGSSPSPSAPTEPSQPAPKKSSALGILNNLIIYGVIAAGGYWAFQQDVKREQELISAENRILDLERQLSATDEEMGESTVAMRAKLEGLIEKTDKLWSEMDKLWASAWRKNQSQIKELRSKTIKTDNKLTETNTEILTNKTAIIELGDKQSATAFNINALTDQLGKAQSVKQEIEKLASQLSSLENKSSSRDQQQIELATMVAELDTSVKLLIERMERPASAGASTTKSPATPTPAQ
ncbi:hypothetical protein [Thalassotalea montiporae]